MLLNFYWQVLNLTLLKLTNGKKCDKVKGFSIQGNTEMNLKSIKQMVLDDDKIKEPIVVEPIASDTRYLSQYCVQPCPDHKQ